MPPADAFEKIADYANHYGDEYGKPYFSIDGVMPITKEQWANMRAKFYCPIGITNVWQEAQLRNGERMKVNHKAIHLNQKPLTLIKQIIEITSDEEDVVWDPFAGLLTTAIACRILNRACYCAEINQSVYDVGIKRIEQHLQNGVQCTLY
jgi:DNA modification methylase